MKPAAAGLLLVLALGVLGAAPEPPDAVVLLIGDAGNPRPGGEPVLRALTREASRVPGRTTVVFLGDNVYPRGLPAPGSRGRAEAERRLMDQLDAVRLPGLRSVFIPGNHDWDVEGEAGLEAIRRQAAFLSQRGGQDVTLLPQDGCPGPEVRDAGARLRLVFLDTQWFLHAFDKPRDPDSPCAADSEAEVVAQLRRVLAQAGERQVLIAGHHPLASGGGHGGHFSTRQHVFPLTDWKPWLWLPLPGIGSLYPAARKAGVSPQDLSSEENQAMRRLLLEALEGHPPLAWAAGHDHSLQVIEGRAPRFVLVSGAGIFGHTTPVRRIEGTRHASSEAGFMRLQFPPAGPARLSVLAVDAQGVATERFTTILD